MGQFVAIRMIVLKPGVFPNDCETFMTGTLLNDMWDFFSAEDRGWEGIAFLRGNKDGLQSYQVAGSRANSRAAGANADYAWITLWKDKDTNEKTWRNPDRPDDWDTNWNEFRGMCYPRKDNIPTGLTPSRPPHGPPYDYLGGVPTKDLVHYGRGAGCLVEGFEVVQKWPRDTTLEA